MSLTIIGILVSVLGPALVQVGFSEVCANEVVAYVPVLVGGMIAWYGRIRKGDLTALGLRK